MQPVRESIKGKTARRLIEILEYFDAHNCWVTVNDLVRRFDVPQSSTSELLGALVNLGILYKDPFSRSFAPTARAAMLGSSFQPALVRDGRLLMLSERLRTATGCGTAIVGMVGVNAQIFRWTAGSKSVTSPAAGTLSGGLQAPLCDSAAGWLLLATLGSERREGMLRRLRAEAPIERKFDARAFAQQVQQCAVEEQVAGPAGFGTSDKMCAVLLPNKSGDRPLALGLIYGNEERIDSAELLSFLASSVRECVAESGEKPIENRRAQSRPLEQFAPRVIFENSRPPTRNSPGPDRLCERQPQQVKRA